MVPALEAVCWPLESTSALIKPKTKNPFDVVSVPCCTLKLKLCGVPDEVTDSPAPMPRTVKTPLDVSSNSTGVMKRVPAKLPLSQVNVVTFSPLSKNPPS
jgi:hypothetical protein